jgi:hypothetical protein
MDRRSFFVNATSFLLLTSIDPIFGSMKADSLQSKINKKVGRVVKMEWDKAESYSAKTYLTMRMQDSLDHELTLKRLIQSDLRKKCFFDLHGLRLSKVEAALLASLA